MYTMEFYSAIKKNVFKSVLMQWMKIESIIQSEARQKEKNKYHALMHIYGIQKEGTDEPICRAAMEMQTREQTYGHGGQEGEGGTNGDSSMETYTLTYVKQIASGNQQYNWELKLGLCYNLEGQECV